MKLSKEQVDAIVAEFVDHGVAFVEDEFTEDGVYNPMVDRENAEMMLRDKLMELVK